MSDYLGDIDAILCGIEWGGLYEAIPTSDDFCTRTEAVMDVLTGRNTLSVNPPLYRESLLASLLLGDPPPA